jgi:hypothetical protein
MSDKLDVVAIGDRRTSFPAYKFPARTSAASVLNKKVEATSVGTSVSYGTINVPAGATNTLLPTLMVYNKFTATISVAAAAGADTTDLIKYGVTDAARAFPFMSCVDSITLTINGKPVSVTSWSQIGAAMRRFNTKKLFKNCSSTPWYPDLLANYTDGLGSSRNSLGSGAVGDFDYQRGCYRQYKVIQGVPSTNNAVVELETWEPVFVSPMEYDPCGPGIPYVASFGLEFAASSYRRILSHAYDASATGNLFIQNSDIGVEHIKSTLFYQTCAPSLSGTQIPPKVSLPYYMLKTDLSNAQVCDFGVPAYNAPLPTGTQFQSALINYTQIPERIYNFVVPVKDKLTVQHPDYTYAGCGNVNISFNNADWTFTNTLPQQWFANAKDAGYDLPWESYVGSFNFNGRMVGSSGTIYVVRPGIDFVLPDGQAVGMQVPVQYQFSGNFLEQRALSSGAAILITVAVYLGEVIQTDQCETFVFPGVLTAADVESAMRKGEVLTLGDSEASFGGGMYGSTKPAKLGLCQSGAGMVTGGTTISGGSSLSGGAVLTRGMMASRHR